MCIVIIVPSSVSVQEVSKLEDHSISFWGKGHVISPEVYVPINIKPEEMKRWQRAYEFNCSS